MNRGCRTASRVGLLLLGGALALACPALAERLAVDAEKGQLSWDPSVGGGPVAEYRLKCGLAPGTYAMPVIKFSPAVTSAQISRILPGPGKYFCAVTAANRYGESGPSNEVVVVLDGARADTGVARSSAPPKRISATNQLVDPDEFRIGPEDSLLISVWKNEALTRTVTVRPDGKISLPLVNDIPAAGLTPSELRGLLSNRLTEYVPTPNVSVIVTEVRSFKISVLGHVKAPGRFEVKSRTTVLEGLSLAGGLDPFASRSRIVILRPDRNTTQRIRFDYSRAISRSDGLLDKIVNLGGGYQKNFYLRPGDIILVP